MAYLDLTGQRFGKLVAVKLAQVAPRKWLCKCDCGGDTVALAYNLRSGNSRACGHCRKPTPGTLRHGHTWETGKSPTYYSWRAMKRRCRDSNRENARYYVGRGIDYDPRWELFDHFLADMGERPEGMTLERQDNDKGYSKENCVWATPKRQTRNRSITIQVTFEGETMPLGDWAERLGIDYRVLYRRLLHGHWDATRSPVRERRKKHAIATDGCVGAGRA